MLDELDVKALGERGSMALGPVTKEKKINTAHKILLYLYSFILEQQNYMFFMYRNQLASSVTAE